jgi:hypothetical protein
MSDDELDAMINRLYAEAQEKVPSAPGRTWGEFISPLFGSFLYRPKLPVQRLNDLRRSYVLDQAAMQDDLPDHMRELIADYRASGRERLESPEEYTGFFGAGSPLLNAAQWMQAVPAMAFEGSGMLANAADDATRLGTDVAPVHVESYGDRVRNILSHIGTAVEPLGIQRKDRMADFVDPQNLPSPKGDTRSVWEKQRTVRQVQADAEDPVGDMRSDPYGLRGLLSNGGRDYTRRQELTPTVREGADHLRDYNVQDLIGDTATDGLGLVMDSVLSPFGETKGAYNFARAGQMGKAWKSMASEYGPLGAIQAYIWSQQGKD